MAMAMILAQGRAATRDRVEAPLDGWAAPVGKEDVERHAGPLGARHGDPQPGRRAGAPQPALDVCGERHGVDAGAAALRLERCGHGAARLRLGVGGARCHRERYRERYSDGPEAREREREGPVGPVHGCRRKRATRPSGHGAHGVRKKRPSGTICSGWPGGVHERRSSAAPPEP